MNNCLFCAVASRVLENQGFYAIPDRYPVNPGHLLIISKRHTPDIFGLDETEFMNLHEIITRAKQMLDAKYEPDGYNLGVNCGEAAGQTINHFHLHIIPRFKGDVENPRGGVRNLKEPLERY